MRRSKSKMAVGSLKKDLRAKTRVRKAAKMSFVSEQKSK